MSIESRELSDLRRDTLDAEAFRASQQLPPDEVERVDESDTWPVRWCYVCHSRKPIQHELGHCLDCDEMLEN